MHSPQLVQRRKFSRRPVDAAVAVCSIVSSSAAIARGHCLNVSEGGAAVIVSGQWIPGQVVRMELTFTNDERPRQFVARIAHRNRLYCGLEFLAVSDAAVAELRELLVS